MGYKFRKWDLGQVKRLGSTDAVSVCDCCGKPGLSKTIALEFELGDRVYHFGCVCAAKALGLLEYSNNVNAMIRIIQRAKRLDDSRQTAYKQAQTLADRDRVAYIVFSEVIHGYTFFLCAESADWAPGDGQSFESRFEPAVAVDFVADMISRSVKSDTGRGVTAFVLPVGAGR